MWYEKLGELGQGPRREGCLQYSPCCYTDGVIVQQRPVRGGEAASELPGEKHYTRVSTETIRWAHAHIFLRTIQLE